MVDSTKPPYNCDSCRQPVDVTGSDDWAPCFLCTDSCWRASDVPLIHVACMEFDSREEIQGTFSFVKHGKWACDGCVYDFTDPPQTELVPVADHERSKHRLRYQEPDEADDSPRYLF